ncbi:MAG: PAS domain S-box protein [Blastocatellia bacterium]
MPSDRAPLDRILEKGLALITPEERATIYRKWVRLPVETPRFSERIWWALLGSFGVVGLGLLGVLWWNRTLAAQVKQRTAALQAELSEREEAEKELRASQNRFITIFRSSPNPVCIARFSDGKILAVNDRWLELSGCTQEDLVGQFDTEMGLWDDFPLRERILAMLRSRQPVRDLEVTYRTKLGEQRHGLLSVEAIRLDGRRCHLWTVQDMTDRKRAQEALQQSEEMFRSLTETTSAWVFIEQDGQFSYVNAAAEAGTGYGRAELITKDILSLVHPDDQDWIRERIQARRRGDAISPNYETRILTQRSETRWLQITTVPIEYRGRFAVLGTGFDITDRKHAEEQLTISEQQLHQLAGYLQTVREEERTAMAREIHDELGQSLTAMKIDLVRLNNLLPTPSEAIHSRISALLQLINATINTVRKLASQLRPGVLDDLGLAAALEWQAQEFQERTGIVCDFVELSEVPGLAPEHATAIFRICQEALTNVARHAEATQVTLRLQATPTHVRLEVKDNGRGVTASELANPRSLGLLGMRERAYLLGGEFMLEGKAGQGTTVIVQIPRPQAKAQGGAS